MTIDQTANFVRGDVSASVGSGDTTISVADASIFPDPANGNYNLVIWDAGNYVRPDLDPNTEVIRVTGRDTTNDNLTVTRAQEGTTAVSHPSSSELHLSATAKVFTDIDTKIDSNLTITGSNGLSGGSAQLGGSIDVSISGGLTLDGDLTAQNGETIWDESATYIPNARLQNDAMTIAGNSVSLGGSTAINHSNLSNIFSDDHHTRYSNEEAQDAVGGILGSNFTYDDSGNTITLDDNFVLNTGDTMSGTLTANGAPAIDAGGNIDVATGSAIRDGSGNSRLFVLSGATRIDDDAGNPAYEGKAGSYNQVFARSGQPFRVRDANGNFDAVSYTTSSSAPGTLELTNADLSMPDDLNVRFGTNDDFSIFYDSSDDDLVIRDTSNGVDLIRQPKQGSTQFLQGADIGSIEAPEDSFTQLANASVTSAAASGDRVGYTFALDNQTILAVDGEADGSGGIQNADITDGSNTIYDSSGSFVPQARLQNDSITVTAGTDLTGGGTVSLGSSVTINHADTSTQGNVSTGGATVIDDIGLDGNGHVNNLNTQNRSLDDWAAANADLNIGNNDLYNVTEVRDGGTVMRIDDGSDRVEFEDGSANRTTDVLANRYYIDALGAWITDNPVSGLDADTVDGNDASDLSAPNSTQNTKIEGGYDAPISKTKVAPSNSTTWITYFNPQREMEAIRVTPISSFSSSSSKMRITDSNGNTTTFTGYSFLSTSETINFPIAHINKVEFEVTNTSSNDAGNDIQMEAYVPILPNHSHDI
jgi:hypothetical protein